MKSCLLLFLGLLCCSVIYSQSDIQSNYFEFRETQSEIRQQLSGKSVQCRQFSNQTEKINQRAFSGEQFKMDSVIYEEEGVDDPFTLQPFDKVEYSYDDDGRLSEEIFYEYFLAGERWTAVDRTTYGYNAEGKLSERVDYNSTGTIESWESAVRYTYQYNSSGDLIELTVLEWHKPGQQWRNQLRFNSSYIAEGQLESSTIYSWSISQGDWVPTFLEEYEYNDRELLTTKLGFSWSAGEQEWVEDSRLSITYDDHDNPIVRSNEIYIEADEAWREMLRIELQYDSRGNVVEELISQVNSQNAFEMFSREEFTYSDEDRILEQVSSLYDSFSDEWVPNFLNEFAYDDNGNPVSESIHFQFEEGMWTPVFENKYNYNLDVSMSDVWSPGEFFLTDLPFDRVHNKLLESSTEELFFQAGLILDKETYFYSEVQPSSTKEFEKSSISVYPVPAGNQVHFAWEGLSEKMEVVIFDMRGKALHRAIISRHEALSVERLNPGMYLYQLSDGENSIQGKLSIH